MAIGTDEETRRDLLILLPVDTSRPVSDLHVQLLGENGLQVTSTNAASLDSPIPQLETRTYPGDSGPVAPTVTTSRPAGSRASPCSSIRRSPGTSAAIAIR